MNTAGSDGFAARPPAQPLVLVAHADTAAADRTRAILAEIGATAILLGTMAEAEIAGRGARIDLLIADVEHGGRGLRLADTVARRSSASIVLLTADPQELPTASHSDRWQVLHRPVHERQLRASIVLALTQRAMRQRSDQATQQRQRQLEQALREIESVIRRYSETAKDEAPGRVGELRPRERQIVDLLLAHKRVPAIADALGISAHTVRNHLKNLYRRVGVHSQQELLSAVAR